VLGGVERVAIEGNVTPVWLFAIALSLDQELWWKVEWVVKTCFRDAP
jgi:hypothetical protein